MLKNNNLDQLEQLQNIYDDMKEEIPEGLYLKLSNISKQLFENLNKNVYKINFINSNLIRYSSNQYKTQLEIKTQIVNLNNTQYTFIKNTINEKGICSFTCNFLLDNVEEQLNSNNSNDITIDCCCEDDDCVKDHQILIHHDIAILNIISI
jgi:hypothetical protein